MSAPAWQTFLAQHQAHAQGVLQLDEELGLRHGLDWADLVLLNALDAADAHEREGASVAALARALHSPASQLLRRLLPLEKTGLLARQAEGPGPRRVRLRPAGRHLLGEARETAQAVCAAFLAERACT